MAATGNLIIVSGPSGSGKSSLSERVLKLVPGVEFSISYTTRQPRGSERDGVEYHFVSPGRFAALREAGEFLEWAEVYGKLYGTSRRLVEEIRARGLDVLLDVDVQGARSIREKCPEATTVFILPPSYAVLRQRLERRRLDKAYVIEQRLRIASGEIRFYDDFEYLIINEDLDRSAEELKAIILGARQLRNGLNAGGDGRPAADSAVMARAAACRRSSRAAEAAAVLASFGGMNAEDSRQH